MRLLAKVFGILGLIVSTLGGMFYLFGYLRVLMLSDWDIAEVSFIEYMDIFGDGYAKAFYILVGLFVFCIFLLIVSSGPGPSASKTEVIDENTPAVAAEIEKLNQLKESGAISEVEFEAEKARIILKSRFS